MITEKYMDLYSYRFSTFYMKWDNLKATRPKYYTCVYYNP